MAVFDRRHEVEEERAIRTGEIPTRALLREIQRREVELAEERAFLRGRGTTTEQVEAYTTVRGGQPRPRHRLPSLAERWDDLPMSAP